MDHGFEAHVDLAAANDLGHIRGVIGFEQSDFQAFVLEIAFTLGEVDRSMVRSSMPVKVSETYLCWQKSNKRNVSRVVPIGQEGDFIGRHFDRSQISLRRVSPHTTETSCFPLFKGKAATREVRDQSHACPFASII